MQKNNALSIAIIIFSLSILISSISISKSIRYGMNFRGNIEVEDIKVSKEENQIVEGILMDDTKAAKYLGLSFDEFRRLVSQDMKDEREKKVSNPYYYIPYIQVGYVNYYSRKELDKWIEHRMFSN